MKQQWLSASHFHGVKPGLSQSIMLANYTMVVQIIAILTESFLLFEYRDVMKIFVINLQNLSSILYVEK